MGESSSPLFIMVKLKTFLSIFLGILFLYIPFAFNGITSVYAAGGGNVLDELMVDPDFNVDDWTANPGDYSLKVIQLAEDENKNIYLYVCQPANDSIDLKGIKVSISYGYSLNGSGLSPKLYDLELMSTTGIFDKYRVVGWNPSTDGDRYYNIVSIYREANELIDGSDPSFPTTGVAYTVGQQWYVCDLNGSRFYEMNTFETLEVEPIFCGNFLFEDGFSGFDFAFTQLPTDCWFYCFNVPDYAIKHIFDADLTYSARQVTVDYPVLGGEPTYTYGSDFKDQVITLSDTDEMSHVGEGIGAKDFKWNRIMSSEDFLYTVSEQHVSVTADISTIVASSQWTFSFLESPRSSIPYQENYVDVYEVSVLRLHFQDFSGAYYDLGVVADLVDPDNNPDGVGENVFGELLNKFGDFWDYFVKIIGIIIGLIVVAFLLVILIPILGPVIKFVLKGIVYIITLPFKLLFGKVNSKNTNKKGGK